ncbi:MAG: rod shape-determining protein RodA [Nitriliruptoraceae bacterium]|nr:rod shape-determining protein RodA [Nitriliruptoraceae bacterium]
MATGDYEDRRLRMQRESVQSRWMDIYDPVRHLDPILVLTALALTGIGLVAIYSAKLTGVAAEAQAMGFVSRQLAALVIGIIGMVIMAVVDYRWLRVYAPIFYGISIVLLGLTLSPLGASGGGAQRWIELGPLQLQPSELAKLAMLVGIAALLHESKGRPHLGYVLIALGTTLVPTALVFLQPDFGTSIVFIWMTAVLFLIAGVKVRYLVALVISGIAGVVVALQQGLLREYQVSRLTAFLDAGDASAAQTAAFQTRQSMIAVGSGQFAGKGLFEGTQTRLSYVPENHTDFIFTVIAEELGFIGGSVVLGLFLVLVWRGLRIAILAKDLFGQLAAAGVVAVLALQVFVNVGMTLGIMPVTGLPLPFVSYGGTSLIVWFAMIGLLLNIHMRRFERPASAVPIARRTSIGAG